MPVPATFAHTQVPLEVEGVHLTIAALHREGELAPIVFLHGFGSSKEDYADIALRAEFAGHAFLAYDAPGCGDSGCSDLALVSTPICSKRRCKCSSISASNASIWWAIPWAD